MGKQSIICQFTWTNDELIQILKDKGKELNRIPKSSDMTNPSGSTFSYRFGSWNDALIQAGFQPLQKRMNKNDLDSKEATIALLRNWCIEHGRVMVSTELTPENNLPSRTAICNRLGVYSWNEILELLDLPEGYVKKSISYPYYAKTPKIKPVKKKLIAIPTQKGVSKAVFDERLLKLVRDRYQETNIIPSIYDFKNGNIFILRFGSWHNVLVRAGIKEDYKKFSKEELIEFLREWCIKNHKIITTKEDDKTLPSPDFIKARLGVNLWSDVIDLLDVQFILPKEVINKFQNKQCQDCGFLIKHRLKYVYNNNLCPKCGSKNVIWAD